MLIDLLSMDNYVHFNIKLAELIGLHAAIYISELLNINEKAVRKDKVKDDCFVVDRSYIQRRTTLSKDEQLEIDKMLVNLGVLKSQEGSEDAVVLDLTVLTALLSADLSGKDGIEKLLSAAKPKKKTKSESIIQNLRKNITTTNEELYKAYCEWIDAVYAKQGWMSAKSVVVAQRTVDSYANHNLDLALKLIELGTISAYRDMQWAINQYEKDYKVVYSVPQVVTKTASAQGLSAEVF